MTRRMEFPGGCEQARRATRYRAGDAAATRAGRGKPCADASRVGSRRVVTHFPGRARLLLTILWLRIAELCLLSSVSCLLPHALDVCRAHVHLLHADRTAQADQG